MIYILDLCEHELQLKKKIKKLEKAQLSFKMSSKNNKLKTNDSRCCYDIGGLHFGHYSLQQKYG
jgi:hypothetical protein